MGWRDALRDLGKAVDAGLRDATRAVDEALDDSGRVVTEHQEREFRTRFGALPVQQQHQQQQGQKEEQQQQEQQAQQQAQQQDPRPPPQAAAQAGANPYYIDPLFCATTARLLNGGGSVRGNVYVTPARVCFYGWMRHMPFCPVHGHPGPQVPQQQQQQQPEGVAECSCWKAHHTQGELDSALSDLGLGGAQDALAVTIPVAHIERIGQAVQLPSQRGNSQLIFVPLENLPQGTRPDSIQLFTKDSRVHTIFAINPSAFAHCFNMMIWAHGQQSGAAPAPQQQPIPPGGATSGGSDGGAQIPGETSAGAAPAPQQQQPIPPGGATGGGSDGGAQIPGETSREASSQQSPAPQQQQPASTEAVVLAPAVAVEASPALEAPSDNNG